MKAYKPQNAPTTEYPTAEEVRNGSALFRAGAVLLATAASAAVLAGCGGEKPADIGGAPTVTTTTAAEAEPMTPGETLVEIGGDIFIPPEEDPGYQGTAVTTVTTTTAMATATESMVLPQGTFVVTDITEPVLLPTGSVCAGNTDEVTSPVTERPTTTVGTYYIPDEEETTVPEIHPVTTTPVTTE